LNLVMARLVEQKLFKISTDTTDVIH
jgi:hypothetical protein